ncbi:hypothetical protein D3C86_1873400 [compost metagenome]
MEGDRLLVEDQTHRAVELHLVEDVEQPVLRLVELGAHDQPEPGALGSLLEDLDVDLLGFALQDVEGLVEGLLVSLGDVLDLFHGSLSLLLFTSCYRAWRNRP